MPAKLNINKVREEFLSVGYVLLTEEYVNSRQKFEFMCDKGHKGSLRLDHLRRGVRCSECVGNKKLTLDQVRKSFELEGYTLLSKEYINSNEKLEYLCPKGHKGSINWNNWSSGNRCGVCFGTTKNNLFSIRDEVLKEGYTLYSTNYKNNKDKLHLICPEGHEYSVSWDNWSSKGSRCPVCQKSGKSLPEIELIEFIKGLGLEVESGTRSIISPYELDIFIPRKNIAIEYCGLYWHSELMGKDRNYHNNKLSMCNDNDIKLITIFEDEWVSKKNIVKSRLTNLLIDREINKIYARKCTIKEISNKEAKEFFCDNHLQGYSISSIRLGLFYDEVLVSAMTFSKPSLSKGHKSYNQGVWELSRYCTKTDHLVVGGPSKLLTYFEKNYEWNELFSYADLRWSTGGLYNKLRFNLVGTTKPNYWYFKNNKERIHRFALRKTKDEPKDRTEWELRMKQNWNRIWDCGNLKYVKLNKKGKDHNQRTPLLVMKELQ